MQRPWRSITAVTIRTHVTNPQCCPGRSAELATLLLEALLPVSTACRAQVQGAVRNHGGGHANHSLFWQVMSPQGGGEPDGELATAMERDLVGLEGLQAGSTQAALELFWQRLAWLVVDGRGKLQVSSEL